MKNKQEIFLRYLENDLSIEEKNEFENKLKNDLNIQSDFNKFAKIYHSSKEMIKVDERYFSTILPNARKKIEKTKISTIKKIAYILPVFIIAGILIISFQEEETNLEYDQLLHTIVEDENDNVDFLNNIYNDDYFASIDDEALYELYINNIEFDETMFDYLRNNFTSSDIDSELLNRLSEDEFNNIYNELNDIKYRRLK